MIIDLGKKLYQKSCGCCKDLMNEYNLYIYERRSEMSNVEDRFEEFKKKFYPVALVEEMKKMDGKQLQDLYVFVRSMNRQKNK